MTFHDSLLETHAPISKIKFKIQPYTMETHFFQLRRSLPSQWNESLKEAQVQHTAVIVLSHFF